MTLPYYDIDRGNPRNIETWAARVKVITEMTIHLPVDVSSEGEITEYIEHNFEFDFNEGEFDLGPMQVAILETYES